MRKGRGLLALLVLMLVGAACGTAPPARKATAPAAETTRTDSSGVKGVRITKVTASSGTTSAELSYSSDPSDSQASLIIDRSSKRVFDGSVEPYSKEQRGTPVTGHGAAPITVTDLDGDDEPEVLLDFYSGGAHCCWWSRIYRWDPATGRYGSLAHLWGNVYYKPTDLDDDGRFEFVSADDRFAYAFTSFAGSGFPALVFTYDAGELSDTTRAYPKLIKEDARQQWHWYREALKQDAHEVRGLLAAWVADECLLDRCKAALATLRSVSGTFADEQLQSGSYAEYVQHLQDFLRENGYLGSSTAGGSSSASRR